MAEQTLIPPKRGEFFTPNGIPTHRFITWIEALTNQTNEHTTEIVTLDITEKYPWPTSQSFDEVKEFDYPAIPQEVPRFNAVTANQNYTAVSYDFINAKSKSTITLPKYPNENDVIIVRNGDGSKIGLNGNGKNIMGSSTGNIYKEGTALELHYFIDSDEWFAR